MDKQSPTGIHVWLILLKAFQSIARLSASSLQESGLGDSDFRVLEVLLHKGAQPVNVIGPKVHLTPGAVSTAIDRLHSRGLVSRVEDTADRRIRIVDLTYTGRELIEPVFCRHAEVMEKLFEVLNAEERIQLEDLLKKAGRTAESLYGKPIPLDNPDSDALPCSQAADLPCG
jgi:MarR family transcriptional regulator, 2-MHQ and catechol-resistance regulon repressor